MTCEVHNKDFEWIQIAPGRKIFRCPACHAGAAAANKKERLDVPLIKYAQSFWRDRDYNSYERSTPGGIAPRPKF